jgi:peptidoglycan biosynthesis protein MviN/MurJ (putative lipid II flippase)
MMRLLPSRELARRVIGVLWLLACVWLLVWILILRNASPREFGDAEEAEILLMLGLSAPLSILIVLALRWVSFSWWIYPENDSRTILAIWFCIFAIGWLQWFVLFPWVVDKGYDLYDFLALRVRRRFGRHEAVDSSSIPKV